MSSPSAPSHASDLDKNGHSEESGPQQDEGLQKLHYLLQQSEVYSGIIGQKMARERESMRVHEAKVAKKEANRQQQQSPQTMRSSTRRNKGVSSNIGNDYGEEQHNARSAAATKKKSKKQSSNKMITSYFTEKDLAKEVDSFANENQSATGVNEIDTQQPDQLQGQPSLVTGAVLRDYQLDGMRWLVTLYENGLNGILADEMGLGKTIQTIAFLSYLRERGVWGPFLIVCPLSTLANWINEFERFTPDFPALLYHGSPEERAELRSKHLGLNKASQPAKNFPVVATTYEIIIRDRKQLTQISWKYVVVDESHRIKNLNSRLAKELRTYPSANRLLLTGTPLQNNLAELWSLLNYILPDIFGSLDDFQHWFDFSDLGSSEGKDRIISSEESNKIVTKLHAILKPFLLRRLKKDVERNLPLKKEYLLSAPLTAQQKELYNAVLNRNIRKYLIEKKKDNNTSFSSGSGSLTPMSDATVTSAAQTPLSVSVSSLNSSSDSYSLSSSTNSLKRERLYDDDRSRSLRRRSSGRQSTKKKRKGYQELSDDDEYFDTIRRHREFNNSSSGAGTPLDSFSNDNQEDDDVLAIAEEYQNKLARKSVNSQHLQNLIMQLRKVCSHPWLFDIEPRNGEELTNGEIIYASGKMLLLNRLLPKLLQTGHKVLLFSQFTKMLDILEDWANEYAGWSTFRVDGSTKPEERKNQMKEFNEDHSPDSCKLFLLSTRAGGVGINLIGADTVILVDSDWNPQMDLQAMDRVHRIGQTKPVLVFRLVTANTVESTIVERASAKRKLEALVIGEGKFTIPGQTAQQILGTKGGATSNGTTATALAEILSRQDGEQINTADKDDLILTDEQLDMLLDRSNTAMNRSATWQSVTDEKGFAAVKVFESEAMMPKEKLEEEAIS